MSGKRMNRILSILMMTAMLLTYNSSIPVAVLAAGEAGTEITETAQDSTTGEQADPSEDQSAAQDADSIKDGKSQSSVDDNAPAKEEAGTSEDNAAGAKAKSAPRKALKKS